MRFYRNVFRLSYARHTFLSKCLACGSIQMSCVRSAPVMRSYRNVSRSITPAVCRIAPNRTACGRLRSYSAVGRDRYSRVLGCRAVIGLCWSTSGLRVFWRRSRRGNEGTRGTEAARQSAFLRDRISFAMFSAGSTLGLRAPNLRQRVECGSGTAASLDSLHAAAGLCWCVFAAPSPGYTERPARVQFMLGRVGLYIDAICYINRPDSKRPQALKSRVARAKRSGYQHC